MKIKLICDSMCDIPEEIVNKEFVSGSRLDLKSLGF